jgi:CRISPR-associated endonuclease/helicase Cas3
MILSALVDGDRLDTEAFAAEGAPAESQPLHLRSYASVAELRAAIDMAIDDTARVAGSRCAGDVEKAVHDYRQAVLAHCREVAHQQAGAFTLDVSTGGGKTLASLAFALRHAERHHKDRVIIVIPFTSIVEQTARAYREALGSLARNVLEHQSGVSDESIAAHRWGPQDPEAVRWRMATENWDAPLIVTTGVQFFESLFSASASRCRKLHNIANSVVVIDEAQTLPPGLLNPTVWALNELVEGYGATVVLSTATQPSLEPPFPEFRNKRPIVPVTVTRPPARVRLELLGAMDWRALAPQLAAEEQVLCITHQRKDARDLTDETDRLLGSQETIHLSAAMCPAHRSSVIQAVHDRLAAGLPCRVVSTQLVEAGVDLDFPVVYRAMAGVDSLVQAAGRANREGRLGVKGGVLRVFRAPTKPPPGLPRLATEAAEGLFRAIELDRTDIDLFGPDLARQFFNRFFERLDDKDGGVTPARLEFRFWEVERSYRFIDDQATVTVVVPYDEDARAQIQRIQADGPSLRLLRGLQRHSVTVYQGQCAALLAAGRLQPLFASEAPAEARRYVLREEPQSEIYHPRFGLMPERVGAPATGAYFA